MNFNQNRSTSSAGLRTFLLRAALPARVFLTLAAGLRTFLLRAVLSARVFLTLAAGLRTFLLRAVLSARVLLTLAAGLRPIQSKTGESLDASILGFPVLIVHGSTFSYLQTGCILEAIPVRSYRSGHFSVWL